MIFQEGESGDVAIKSSPRQTVWQALLYQSLDALALLTNELLGSANAAVKAGEFEV